MGMPAWAAVLAAPYAADKLLVDPISSVYGLYKGIRDDQADQSDKQVGMDLLKQFAVDPNTPIDNKMLSKFKDPKAAELAITHALGIAKGMQTQQAVPQVNTLENYAAETGTTDPRFFNDPASREELAKQGFNGDLSFFSRGYSDNPVTNTAAKEINNKEALRTAQRQIYEGTAGPSTYADMAVNPVAKANDAVLNTNMNTLEKARTRDDKEKAKVDLADFQTAVAGITGPSKSPFDLKRFAARGGYDTFPGVESDIRLAAADYNAPADVVNNEIDNARSLYKDTFLPMETVKVGRTSATGQKNLLGDFKKDVQSTAPININTPRLPSIKRISANNVRRTDGTIGPGIMSFDVSIPEDAAMFRQWVKSGRGVEVGMDSSATIDDMGNKTSHKTAPGVLPVKGPVVSVTRGKDGKLVIQR